MPVLSPTGETLAEIQARHERELAEHRAARPGDFVVSGSPSIEQAIAITRKHLYRYPKTDCALALSLKGLFEGVSSSYVR